MVIDDQDAVDPPALAVFCDIWKVTGISLPHFPKGVLFKSLPVPHVRVTCRFQVMFLYKTLDSTHADRGRDERLFHEVAVDLCGVKPWESFLKPVDLLDGCIRQDPGAALVGAFPGHKCIDAAVLVERHPLADSLGAVAEGGTIRQGERVLGDALVIGISGRIRIKAMDDRCDEGKPELCHGGSVRKVLLFVVHKNILLKWFSAIIKEFPQGDHAWACGRGKAVQGPNTCWQ